MHQLTHQLSTCYPLDIHDGRMDFRMNIFRSHSKRRRILRPHKYSEVCRNAVQIGRSFFRVLHQLNWEICNVNFNLFKVSEFLSLQR